MTSRSAGELLTRLDQLRRIVQDISRDKPELGRAWNALRVSLDAFLVLEPPTAPAPVPEAFGEGTAAGAPGPASEPLRRRGAPLSASLDHVGERSSLKAQACELAAKLLLQPLGTAERARLEAQEAELFQRARELPDCYLWALDRKRVPLDPALLARCALCYSNLAAAAQLAQRELPGDLQAPPPKRLMSLLAEAQSSLYAVLQNAGVRGERDQLQVFAWLRERTDMHRIYLPRFMDKSRLADPNEAEDLAQRISSWGYDGAAVHDTERLLAELKNHLPEGGQLPEGDLRRQLQQALEPSQAGSRLDRVVDALRPNLRDQEVLERIASRLRSVLGELEGGGSAP
jgi:hypothetical protein